MTDIPLVDWATVMKTYRGPPCGIKQTALKLVHVLLQYWENLIPGESLMTLIKHAPLFWLRPNIDFPQWQQHGINLLFEKTDLSGIAPVVQPVTGDSKLIDNTSVKELTKLEKS